MEKDENTTVTDSTSLSTANPENHETEKKPDGESRPTSLGTSSQIDEPPTVNPEDWEYVTGLKLAVVIIAVTAACFVMLLDTSIVVTAIPKITSDFHSLEDIGWYGSAFLLSSSALQPMAGKLYAQFSSKYTFVLFLALFELGSLLCGVARSSKMLIVGRAVAGMGGSGLINGALTIIAACVPLEKRPMHLGIMFGVAQLGILFGPLIGGALTEYASWRWCFYINLPPGGIIAAFILVIKIPDRRIKSQVKVGLPAILDSLDLPGFALFAPAAIMFLLALEWGGTTYPWNSAHVIGLFCGSAGVLALFLAWEYRRGETAMIPLSMLKMRVVWMSCLVQFFVSANMLTNSYYMAIYFQTIKGIAPALSGVYLLPSILSQMSMAVISGALVGRLGYYLPWIIGATAIAAVGSGLLSTLKPGTAVAQWVIYQMIGGAGRGSGMQMPIVAVQNHLKPELASVGMSALVFSQGFGSALFLSFAQTTFSAGLRDSLPHFAPEVNAQMVIDAGATAVRQVVPKASLKGVLLAYDKAFSHVMYLAVGAAIGGFIFSWGLGWKSVKKAKAVPPTTATVAEP